MFVDPTRCPDCGEVLTGASRCAACGLLVRGPVALQLWQVATEIDRLTERREALLRALRAPSPAAPAAYAPQAAPAAYAPQAATAAAPAGTPAPASLLARPPAGAGAPAPAPYATSRTGAPAAPRPDAARAYDWSPPPPRPRKEWTPQRVQNVLLMTGTLLLAVAAVVFTAFTWGRLPIAARGGIMLAITAATGWSAGWLYRRGLTASAEAIALLTMLFAAVDAYAVHATNLFGLGGTDRATYWSVASGVLAGLSAAFGRVLPVRSLRYAALAGAQLPLAVTAFRMPWYDAQRGALLAVQAALLGAGAYRLGESATAARLSAAANWVVAAGLALTTAFGWNADETHVRVAALVLVLVGAVALLWPGDRTVPAGVATAFAVLALAAPARLTLTFVQFPAVLAAAGLIAVVAAVATGRAWRRGPLAVGTATVGLALAAVSVWVAEALVLPFTWVSRPWTVEAGDPVRAVVGVDHEWGGSVVTLGVVAVAALTAVLAAEALGRRAAARWWVVVLASAAVLLVPLGFAASYGLALGWYVVAGAAGLAASRAFRTVVPAATATVVLAVATAWSLANEPATVAVLGCVTLAYAAYAAFFRPLRDAAAGVAAAAFAAFATAVSAAGGAPLPRTGFVLAAAGCVLMGAAAYLGDRVRTVEPVAGCAYLGALALALLDPGWFAWALGAGALTAGLSAARPGRRMLAGPAAVLGVGAAAATAVAYGLPAEQVGFVVAAAACVAAVAGVLPRLLDVQAVAGVAYAVGVGLTAGDVTWLSYALGAGAVMAAALSLVERVLTPVAAALAIACAGTTAYALGAPLGRTGFVVAVAAALAAGVAYVLRDENGLRVEVVAAAGYTAGLGLSFADMGWTAWTLAVGAAATTAVAARADRRPLAGSPALLTAACSAATAAAFGLAPEQVGFALGATACALAAAGTYLRLRDVALVGALAYGVAVLATGEDPGWLSWLLGLGALTSGAAAYRYRRLAPLPAALAVACAGTAAYALGAPLDRTGFVVAVAAVAAVAAGALLGGEPGEQVEAVGAVTYLGALVLASPDPGWLSWVLLAGGITALAEGMRPERRPANWVATALLTAWAWDRLWLEDVRMPEAYAAPVAGLLLVLGHLRRRRDPDTGSWTAYGRGLVVAFLPTTYLVFTDPGVTRPVCLALAGLVVLLAGVKERLQAPLTVGATALAVDAFVQLAPVAVALPKWATIGAVGLLVIVVGVTYEDRRRDVEKLRETIEGMG